MIKCTYKIIYKESCLECFILIWAIFGRMSVKHVAINTIVLEKWQLYV